MTKPYFWTEHVLKLLGPEAVEKVYPTLNGEATVYYDLVTDGSGLSLAAPPVQVPLGAGLKLSHRAPGEIDLELRLLHAPYSPSPALSC